MTDPNPAAYPPSAGNAHPNPAPPPPAPGAYPPPVTGAPAPAQYGAPVPQQGAPGGYPAPQAGYPAPQYGYAPPQAGPPTPQYGYPAPQAGYPAPVYGQIPPSGRLYWGLLFLFYIPYLGILAAPIVALVQRAGASRSPHEIIRENARWAANWALSYVLYLIALIAITVIIGVASAADSLSHQPSALIVLPVALIFAIGIYCLVTMIRGSVVANRVVHRPALAIPFFRA